VALRTVVAITGASSGIGAEFARKLAAGHDLILIARRKDKLEELAAEPLRRYQTNEEIVLADVAAAHGANLHQVALAFLTRKPSLFAIPKAARLLHVEENAKSADIKLSEADVARLEEAFPLGVKPRGLPMI